MAFNLEDKLDRLKDTARNITDKMLHRRREDDEEYLYQDGSDSSDDYPSDIEMPDEEEEEGRQLRKKRILVVGAAVAAVAVGAMAYSALTPDTPKEAKQKQSLAQNTGGRELSGTMPSSYQDIAKYQDKNSRGGAVKTTTAPGSGHGTMAAGTQRPAYRAPAGGSQAASSRTGSSSPSRPSYSAPARSSASGSTHTGSAPQARVTVTKDTARERALQEEQAAQQSSIAFQIAKAVTSAVTGAGTAESQAVATPAVAVTASRSGWLPEDAYDMADEYDLQAGSVIQATLLTGITTDSPNGDVVAQVRQNIYDSQTGMHLLIPQGSRLIGRYGGAGGRGNERVGVTFTRILLPNGYSIDLPNQNAIDGTGLLGLKDQYTQHSSSLFRTGIMTGLIAAAAQSATGNTSGSDTRSPGQEAVSGAVSQILDTADELIRRDASVAPTVTIRPGIEFSVFINQDLPLREYTE